MITLNLLPPEEKQKIAGVQRKRKVLISGGAGLILVLVFLSFLSSIWLFLLIQLNSAESVYKNIQTSYQSETYKKFESEVSQINGILSYSDKLENSSRHYSFVLEKLTELVSDDIKFVSFSANGSKIILNGFAANQQSLLAFKDSLSQSLYFGRVNMPLNNFLKQEDINFFVEFEIKE